MTVIPNLFFLPQLSKFAQFPIQSGEQHGAESVFTQSQPPHHHLHLHPLPLPRPVPPVWRCTGGLCGSDCGAQLQEFGSVRGFGEPPHAESHSAGRRAVRLGSFQSAATTQWPPQKAITSPSAFLWGTWESRARAGARGDPG